MTKWLLNCVALSLMFTLVSCGSDDSDSSSSSSSNAAMTAALSSVTSTTNAASDLIGESSAKVDRLSVGVLAAGGFGANWTGAGKVNSLSNSGTVSIAQWMEDEFNPSFVNSNNAKVTFAGRIANALGIFCFMAYGGLATDSTGLPKAGTHTMTLTNAMGTACGEDMTDMAGSTVTITVTDTGDTTYYDKKYSIDLPESNCPFLVYVRSNSSSINVATSEDQSCDGRNQASRTVFHYNKSTKKALFSYISQNFDSSVGSPGGFEFYRGYLDQAADKGYMLGYYGADAGASLTSYVAYSVVGKPVAGGTSAVSVETDSQTVADGTYQACVNISNNTLATDNSLACTMTGVNIEGNAGTSGAIKTAHDANSARADIYNIDETTTPGFTDNTDMY